MEELKEDVIKEEVIKKEVIQKENVITLDKPFLFETETHTEIDLSNLDQLTTEELITAEKIYHRVGGNAFNPETTVLYSAIIAHLVSKKPIEFIFALPSKEAMKVKQLVSNFLFK